MKINTLLPISGII